MLKDLVASVYLMVKRRIPDSIEFRTEIPDDLSILTNGAVLNQILMNLIVNAADAIAGYGTISVSAKTIGNAVEIAIQDTGSGMDKKLKDRIFEPFFTTKDVGQGTGLGLHICKTEIEKLSGNIQLESEVGFGSKFILTFPQLLLEHPIREKEAA